MPQSITICMSQQKATVTTSEILDRFAHYEFFNRDLLYYFVKTKHIKYNSLGRLRDFPPVEVQKLEVLLKKYALKRQIEEKPKLAENGSVSSLSYSEEANSASL